MDHQALWERLRKEMCALRMEGVKSVHPQVVLRYMGFLEKIEEHKHEQGNKG